MILNFCNPGILISDNSLIVSFLWYRFLKLVFFRTISIKDINTFNQKYGEEVNVIQWVNG